LQNAQSVSFTIMTRLLKKSVCLCSVVLRHGVSVGLKTFITGI